MADPNLTDFYVRLRRIEKIYRRGGGFEAVGTLGRSYYTRRPRKPIPIVGPLLIVAAAVIGLKGMIHAEIGPDLYNARVQALQLGDGIDPIGAFIMQPDPVSLYVSQKLRSLLH